MRKALLVVLLLATSVCFADNTSSNSSLPSDQEPVQQFVTADPIPVSSTVTSTTITSTTSAAPTPTVSPTNMVPPALTENSPVALPSAPMPEKAPPLAGDKNNQASANSDLSGDLNENALLTCQLSVAKACPPAQDDTQFQTFQTCLIKAKPKLGPVCKQFIALAKGVNLGPGDTVDLIKTYPQAKLTLIHVTYFGANYSGVYYTLNTQGQLLNLVSGPLMNTVHITQAVGYDAIVKRFPQVELFSDVVEEQLPQAQQTENGQFRLLLRYKLYNGCHACAFAGYANVAYDFSSDGVLQQAKAISLEPPLTNHNINN